MYINSKFEIQNKISKNDHFQWGFLRIHIMAKQFIQGFYNTLNEKWIAG